MKKEFIYIKRKDLENLKEKAKEYKQVKEKNTQLENQIQELKDKYLRIAAEFDNYKKRVEREKKEIFQYGMENFILQLLPYDEIFEKVLVQMEKNKSFESIHEGIVMLKKEFTNLLTSLGIKRIETKEKEFDPNFHEVSSVIETSEVPEGKIVEEERPGYLLYDKVLRPAFVKIAKHVEGEKQSSNKSKNSSKT